MEVSQPSGWFATTATQSLVSFVSCFSVFGNQWPAYQLSLVKTSRPSCLTLEKRNMPALIGLKRCCHALYKKNNNYNNLRRRRSTSRRRRRRRKRRRRRRRRRRGGGGGEQQQQEHKQQKGEKEEWQLIYLKHILSTWQYRIQNRLIWKIYSQSQLLTLSSPSFFDVSQSRGEGIPPTHPHSITFLVFVRTWWNLEQLIIGACSIFWL